MTQYSQALILFVCLFVCCDKLMSSQLFRVPSRLPQGHAFQLLGLFSQGRPVRFSRPRPPRGPVTISIGPETRCDAAHLQWVFQGCCDTEKSLTMICDVNSNMFNSLLLILKYLGHLLSDFQFASLGWGFNKLSCDM